MKKRRREEKEEKESEEERIGESMYATEIPGECRG